MDKFKSLFVSGHFIPYWVLGLLAAFSFALGKDWLF